MAEAERKLSNGREPDRFPDRSVELPPLEAQRRRRRRHLADGRRREGRAVRGLRAQAQFLRPRRRYRARRRHRAAALRAPAGEGRPAALGQAAGVLRRRQYPHAGGRLPRPQGQLLQVHQRDPQRHRGRQRVLGPRHHLRDQRHGGRRRLRARARRRPHHADRRRHLGGVAAGVAAARGAARHRRAHPRHRQAQGAPRPCRRVLHHRGGRQGQARGRLAAGRRGGAGLQARGDRGAARAREFAARSDRPAAAKGIALTPLERMRSDERRRVQHGRRSSSVARRAARASSPCAVPMPRRRRSAEAMVAAGRAFWPLGSRASSTTPSSTSAPTSSTSPRSCSSRPAIPRRCWPTTHSSTPTRSTGSAREISGFWKRALKRVDLTSRSLVALVEPGSCFAGTLAELVLRHRPLLHADRQAARRQQAAGGARARAGEFRRLSDVERALAARQPLPRRPVRPSTRRRPRSARCSTPKPRRSWASSPSRSTTSTGRTRSACSSRSARASRADGLTGLEANLRFGGPETMEIEDLRPPHRLAELDLPAPQRGRRGRRAQALRHRPEAGVRHEKSVTTRVRSTDTPEFDRSQP